MCSIWYQSKLIALKDDTIHDLLHVWENETLLWSWQLSTNTFFLNCVSAFLRQEIEASVL